MMREWDESRNCVHAINMAQNHDWLVRHYDTSPDMWETKPPMLVWLQVICLKLFGYSLAIFRLPSALAALGTALLLFSFLYRKTNSIIAGLVAACVLVTAHGYLYVHCARSADHEALLLLFETGMLITFYQYLTTEAKQKSISLMLCFVCFTLAVFTKSIAVVMFLPGMFIYLLFSRKAIETLKNWRVYVYAIASLAIVGLYYYLHEQQTPGYLQAVWENELFPRFFNSSKQYTYNNVTSPFQYLGVLKDTVFNYWIWLVAPCVIAVLIIPANKVVKQLGVFFIIQASCFYIVISRGTFNLWYANPLLPLFAMLIGLGAYSIYMYLFKRIELKIKGVYVNVFAVVLFLVVLYKPFYEMVKRANTPYFYPQASYGFLFTEIRKTKPEVKQFKLLATNYNQSIFFYYTLFTKVYGYGIEHIASPKDLSANTLVMTGDEENKKQIDTFYNVEVVAHNEFCTLYKIGQPK